MHFKIKLTSPFVGLLLLIASTQAISALPGESIVLDPSTGDYTITYWDYPKSPKKRLQQVIFVPSTKIDPLVKSAIKFREEGVIAYTYRVTNSLKSRQSLVAMRFDPVTDIVSALPLPKNDRDVDLSTMEQVILAGEAALSTPYGWNGGSYSSQAGGLRISWSYAILHSVNDGLKPGNTQGGFGFSSRDIPGIGIAKLSGQPLYINDASLIWGGLFDVGSTPWKHPHKGHRRGTGLDIRAANSGPNNEGAVPATLFGKLSKGAAKENIKAALHCTQNNVLYIGIVCNGIPNNRHFHVDF